MVTTNQKAVLDTHTKKTKESKHKTKNSQQNTKEEGNSLAVQWLELSAFTVRAQSLLRN